MKGLTKKDLALFITRVVYQNPSITEDHFFVEDLTRRKKEELEDLFDMACKALDSELNSPAKVDMDFRIKMLDMMFE